MIRPSALRWSNLTEGDRFWRKLTASREEYAVCYSNHASCDELKDFLNYLKPAEVRFNVLPKHDPDGLKMRQLLGAIYAKEKTHSKSDISQKSELINFKGIVYRKSDQKTNIFEDNDEDDTLIEQLPKRVRS